MLGPNGAIGEGSLTAMIQATGDYIVKAIRKIQKERVKRMVVRAARVRDFLRYCDAGLHCLEALRSPRWEDYEYVYRAEEGEEANPMGWLGNGWVQNQLVPEVRDIDLGYYIMPQFQEYPRHPRPEEDERDRIQPWSY
ncbi:putative sterigmatocystin biosynthesis monooxygenase stcW [Teratosphaeria destructans]|uniref:Sterigmatocystin biosynthesis monooxygenase stcW n=1 Tax=Teratosphaeria destructans TaxID=418781 RepID=A0A9W7SP75_9PEZI|nr:putative sterigmatocystin biosynthesis monooxygenase stcW [Teratosphaeria destructans]